MMSESREAGTPGSGRKSCCLIGCLGGGFLIVALMVSGGAWIQGFTARFGEADELRVQREELAARQPFRPAADGRVPPERLEAYMRVRRGLLETCTQFEGFFGAVEELEERDSAGDEPGFRDGLAVAWAGMKLPGVLAGYFEARNRGLVEEEMSLEEWRWYTVLAYRTAGGSFVSEGTDPERSDARGGGGDRELLRRTLDLQLEAARAAGAEAVGADWLAALEAESLRLDEPDGSGWPWTAGLPARVAESMQPAASDLIATHCRHAEEFELDEVEQDGVTVRVQ